MIAEASVSRRLARRVAGAALLCPLLLVAASCGDAEDSDETLVDSVRVTPAPAAFTRLDSATRSAVVQEARRAEFDTTRGSSDAQYLMFPVRGNLVVGPYATIAPEVGARRLTKAQLAAGRFVARIESRGAYAAWGLEAGTTWVWIDSVAAWRMVLVPEAPGAPVVALAIDRHDHFVPRTLPACQMSRTRFIRREGLMATGLCFRCDCEGWCSPTVSGADSSFALTILTLR